MIKSLEDFLRLLKRTKKYVKWSISSNGVIRGELKSSLRLGGLRVTAFSPETCDEATEMGVCPVTAIALLKGQLLDTSMIDWAAILFESKDLMKEIVHASDYPELCHTRADILKILF